MTRIERSLTALEAEALATTDALNLADGHPRMPLTASQQAILSGLPAMFEAAAGRRFTDIEREAHTAFYHCLGQFRAPIGTGRILSTYSSTIALDIAACVLRRRTRHVAMIHPTFDNIADVFRTRGLRLHPVTQEQLDSGSWHPPARVGAVVVVSPNNPTGWVLDRESLRKIARRCARSGQVLLIDASFRGQDDRAQYDTYQVLDETDVEWAVVEDSGKLWPVNELKAGFLGWSATTALPFVAAFNEVMLSMSPVILLLIARLSADAQAGGFDRTRTTLEVNRALIADALAGTPARLSDPHSRISVARLHLPAPGPDAHAAYRALVRDGIHTLPCSRFYWARPRDGDRQLRLSLARPPGTVERAARALARLYQ